MYSRLTGLKKAGLVWLAGMCALTVVSTGRSAQAQEPHKDAADQALAWMKSQQQPDGSFPGFGTGSTVDALLAIMAGQQDPSSYSQGGNTPITYLQGKVGELSQTTGGAGKLLLAVGSLGMDGKSFGGVNLVDAINATYDANIGQYGKDVIGHAFAVLGLRAAGQPVPPQALIFLQSANNEDGGWSFSGEKGAGKSDTNTTSVVIQAFIAAGAQEQAQQHLLRSAWVYLMSQQNPDGGFPYQKGGEFGSDSDVNSTAYATQAILALGGGQDAVKPMQFLLSMQKPNGAFQWMASEPDDNPGATYQAIPALLGATLVRPIPLRDQVPPTEPGVTPGTPRTGQGDATPIAVTALAAIALAAGVALRRRAATN